MELAPFGAELEVLGPPPYRRAMRDLIDAQAMLYRDGDIGEAPRADR